MKSITVQVSDETARHIDSLIASGQYISASEYVAMLIEREQHSGELPQWMEEELLKGVDSLERGEAIVWTPEVAEKMKQDFLERVRRERGEVA